MTTPSIPDILAIAENGEKLCVSLHKFAARYPERQVFVLVLASTTGMTASLLRDLSTTISTYDILPATLINPLILSISGIFKQADKALNSVVEKEDHDNEVEVGEWEDIEGGGRVRGMKRLRSGPVGTGAFLEELGGVRAGDELQIRLEELKSFVWYLGKAARYLGLKEAEKKNPLGKDERIELSKLVELLPEVARGLGVRKEPLLRLVEMGDDIKLFPGPEYGGETGRPLRDDGIPIELDDDSKSYVSSADSSASDVFQDTQVVYETWTVRKMEDNFRQSGKSWRIFGVKVIREISDSVEYNTEPKASSQKELKAKYDDVQSSEWKKALDERVVLLHPGIRSEISSLLEDREHYTSSSRFVREWVLVDVQPCPPRIASPKASWLSWWKGEPAASSWFVVIKGYTLEGDLKFPKRTEIFLGHRPHRERVFQRSIRRDQVETFPTRPTGGQSSLPQIRIGQEQELVGITQYLGQDEDQKKIEAILTEVGGLVQQSSSS